MMDPSHHRGAPSHAHPRQHRSRSNSNDHNHHRVRFAEEDPKVHHPTPQRPRPAAAAPSVYWDDRDNDANLAQYTFYRESTPTPPEDEARDKELGHGGPVAPVAESSAAAAGGFGSEQGFNGPHSEGERSHNNGTDPAKKKKIIRAIIVTGVLVIIGIAVGVGVGLGMGLKQSPEEAEAVSSVPPASAYNSGLVSTTTSTASHSSTDAVSGAPPSMTATSRPKYNSDCPALNNTIYNVPGSTKSFLRLCGIDYSGSGAIDLAHVYTGSMAECITSCASFDQCTACSWGYIDGDSGSEHRCYMKKDLKKGHTAASDWCLAILQ